MGKVKAGAAEIEESLVGKVGMGERAEEVAA